MLSDNIKKYRKANNMSQDELAQKLDVTRQSISLWETGQSQPTIDNIIALTKIFGISSDKLLDTSVGVKESNIPRESVPTLKEDSPALKEDTAENDGKCTSKKVRISGKVIAASVFVLILLILLCVVQSRKNEKTADLSSEAAVHSSVLTQGSESTASASSEPTPQDAAPSQESENTAAVSSDSVSSVPVSSDTASSGSVSSDDRPTESGTFDLFDYCKGFAIQKGTLNGDYCIYQQSSTLYGGYDNEYFSISYWGDSNMVEFCLHCPLSETQSINFYLRMRGGYDGKYEYLSSKYHRSDGTSIRSASGYIDPSVFSDKYPLSCDSYDGSADGQTEFMEESRVGMCDLIKSLKQFVSVEKMECSFSDFGFVNF